MKSSIFGQRVKRRDAYAKAKRADKYKSNQLSDRSRFYVPQPESHFPCPELPVDPRTKCAT